MEPGNKAKPLDTVKERGERLTEKICPFDKKTCIRDQCAVFRDDLDRCAFLLIGKQSGAHPYSQRSTGDQPSGKFKAHLFE